MAGPARASCSQESDTELFRELFVDAYESLLRFAVRRVGRDAAPDVVSDAFLAGWRRRRDIAPADVEELRSWLFGATRMAILSHARKCGRRDRLLFRLGQDRSVIHPEAGDSDFENLYVALGRLCLRDQELLRLAEWDCLSAEEMATVLGCSVGAVRVRLHRARARLAREITEHPWLDRSSAIGAPTKVHPREAEVDYELDQ
jgi:RNA polymerase sigma-70 factor (ECF subfamily)